MQAFKPNFFPLHSCTQGGLFLFSRPSLHLFFWLPGGFLPTCTNTSTSCQYRTRCFQSIPWASPHAFPLFELFYSIKDLNSSQKKRAASMHICLQRPWFPVYQRPPCWQPLTPSRETKLCSSVGHGNPQLPWKSPSAGKPSARMPAQPPSSDGCAVGRQP